MEGNAVAGTRRRCGDFRQCYNHLSALGDCRSVHADELARLAWRAGSRVVETLPFLGAPHLSPPATERAGIAFEAACVLAITSVDRHVSGGRAAADLGH